MQVCKYDSMQVYNRYARMQACKHAGMQVYKYGSKQICKNARMQ